MNMQVRNFLTAVAAGVDHRSETVFAAGLFCKNRHKIDHFTQQCRIFGSGVGQRLNVLFGNDQKMHGGLGVNVIEGDDVIVFLNLAGGNIAA